MVPSRPSTAKSASGVHGAVAVGFVPGKPVEDQQQAKKG